MPTSIRETHLALQRVLPPGMQTADGKAGIGISFAPDMEGYQIIQSMAPQGAAAACGQILAGDIIVSVDGKQVRSLAIKDVVDLIKGVPNSTVTMIMGRRVSVEEIHAAAVQATVQAQPVQQRSISPPPAPQPAPAPRPPPAAPPPPPVQQQPPATLYREPSPPPMEQITPVPPPPPQQHIAPVPAARSPSPPPLQPQMPSPPALATQPAVQPTPDSKQNGFVVKNWPDGKQYRGEMLDGKRHGKGSITYPDGASYEGDWHNDWRHGHGEYKYTDGTWYKGHWEMGNRQGEGLCTYADGNMFQGSWVANLPHGKGQCRFAEGSLYRGEFVMGKMHGVGTLIRHDGSVAFEGEWRDGEKVAPSVSPQLHPASQRTTPAQSPMQSIQQPPMQMQQLPVQQQSMIVQRSTPPPQEERKVHLYVLVKGVSHMPRAPQGAPNPYVVVSHALQSHITRTLHQTFEPRWEAEVGEFSVRDLNDLEPLLIRVFDWSPNNSDLVGEVELDVRDPSKYRVQQELTFKLMRPDGSLVWGQDGQQAELYASIALTPPVYRQPAPPIRAASPTLVYQAPQPQPEPVRYSPPRQQVQSMSIAPRQVQQVQSVQRTVPNTYSMSSMPLTMGSGRCGVGLKLIQPNRNDNVSIDKIQKDSAADVSGRLRSGDVVLKVDGQPITDLEQAKELLIGQEGTSVALEIARSDGAIRISEVVLTRKNLSIRRDTLASSTSYDRGSSQGYPSSYSQGYQSQNSRPMTQHNGGGGSSYDPWSNESRRTTNGVW